MSGLHEVFSDIIHSYCTEYIHLPTIPHHSVHEWYSNTIHFIIEYNAIYLFILSVACAETHLQLKRLRSLLIIGSSLRDL